MKIKVRIISGHRNFMPGIGVIKTPVEKFVTNEQAKGLREAGFEIVRINKTGEEIPFDFDTPVEPTIEKVKKEDIIEATDVIPYEEISEETLNAGSDVEVEEDAKEPVVETKVEELVEEESLDETEVPEEDEVSEEGTTQEEPEVEPGVTRTTKKTNKRKK